MFLCLTAKIATIIGDFVYKQTQWGATGTLALVLQKKQSKRWPGIVRVWRKINDAVWHTRHTRHTRHFTHPDQQWEWWLDRDAKSDTDDSCPLFDGVTE